MVKKKDVCKENLEYWNPFKKDVHGDNAWIDNLDSYNSFVENFGQITPILEKFNIEPYEDEFKELVELYKLHDKSYLESIWHWSQEEQMKEALEEEFTQLAYTAMEKEFEEFFWDTNNDLSPKKNEILSDTSKFNIEEILLIYKLFKYTLDCNYTSMKDVYEEDSFDKIFANLSRPEELEQYFDKLMTKTQEWLETKINKIEDSMDYADDIYEKGKKERMDELEEYEENLDFSCFCPESEEKV